MSSIQLKVLISKVQDDAALQNQINNAQSPEKVLAIAKEHGFELSQQTSNPTDQDLEDIAGGAKVPGLIGQTGWQTCGQDVAWL